MSSQKPDSTTPTHVPEPPRQRPSPPFDQVISTILHRVLMALSCRSLLPTDLARLASAAATLTRAHAYAQTAELQRQLLRAKINKLTPPPEEDFFSPENLEKVRARVRAIYGIDWDFANPPADDPSWEPPPGFIGEYIPEGSSVPTIRSAHVKMCDTVRQSGTFADKPNPNTPASPAHPPTSNSQLLTSTSTPRRTCDIPGQGETFTDTPAPNTHLASPPPSPRLRPMPDSPLETREERVESETCVPPSRAVLCPDTRRETPNPEKRPDKIESPGISSPHPPSSIPDTLPSKICDNTGQCETSAASPAHRPASDFQLPTSNSQLLASTSTSRPTCDNTGQNETSAASPAHRPASDFQLLSSNSQLLASNSPKTYEESVESETPADNPDPHPNEEPTAGMPSHSPCQASGLACLPSRTPAVIGTGASLAGESQYTARRLARQGGHSANGDARGMNRMARPKHQGRHQADPIGRCSTRQPRVRSILHKSGSGLSE